VNWIPSASSVVDSSLVFAGLQPESLVTGPRPYILTNSETGLAHGMTGLDRLIQEDVPELKMYR